MREIFIKLDRDTVTGVRNLHDVFLNASLVKKLMDAAPIEEDPILFCSSDRGRLERLWVALLFVLVEAWESSQMATVRAYVSQCAATNGVANLLRQARRDRHLDRMREARAYMFHRDKREYWDDGRHSVVGGLEFHHKLHMAFSQVMLAAMRHLNKELGVATQNPRLDLMDFGPFQKRGPSTPTASTLPSRNRAGK